MPLKLPKKIGLNNAILQAAKQKIGAQQKRVDTLLIDLERDKKDVYDAKISIAQKERQLARLKADNEQLQAYLEDNKKTIINKAKEEAREIIRNANKLVENTISDIKASQADKQKTKLLRQQLDAELNKHTDRSAIPVPKSKQITSQTVSIEVGDWVKIPGTGNEAEVIGVSKNNLVLAMGELRMVKKRNEVEPIAKKKIRPRHRVRPITPICRRMLPISGLK